MKPSTVFLLSLSSGAVAFPWLHADFADNAKRGLEVVKKDPELVALLQSLYQDQLQERDDFLAAMASSNDEHEDDSDSTLEKRASTNCLPHTLPDFLPSNITGLKKFPEAAYPYQDPKPSDQRGPCPGLNTLANHGYIPRNGIATVAQTVIAAARVFNMGADLSTFLAGGSVLFAGDIPSMRYSIGGADSRTNSAGALGSALGTETGLSGHLRFKEGDASGTRCDFYLCNGDNHNLNGSVFLDLQDKAKNYGGGQYNVRALIHHSAAQYQNSRSKNPNFYFLPPSAALTIGATYFQAGFFSNGTIGFGGVANEASIASFDGAFFNDNGTVSYQPEQIPPQGWYRRGFPMFLSEGVDGIITMYSGIAEILGEPDLFGFNTGTAGDFNGQMSLSSYGGNGNYGGTTVNGTICALEETLYANFVNEFNNVLSTAVGALSTVTSIFGNYGCPVPSGAPAAEADTTAPGYPKPSPCTLNRMENGLDQCSPDTNTYDRFNSKSIPFCLNSPSKAAAISNPLPVPGMV
ncbi:Cloroperoxidase [Aureobasidium sp. EXF-10728]|nr:Cloroperoxidase [Aureobasidium sp. EXF-10728]